RISRRQRGDVGNELGFIECAAFFVGEDAVIGEIFFPRRLVYRNDGGLKFLRATDQFVLGDRRIGEASGSSCDNQKRKDEFKEHQLIRKRRIRSWRSSMASFGLRRLRTFSRRSGSIAASSRTSLLRVLYLE